ncbi:unnamed protein product [Ambrosiozyma monospora]|uniref:Unnamed protein product n=1 Tax=Ambrosiozyma monospora TaxID=43982 RepID=A0ACB5T727_AMBMO|nr:unnamed protein product [Ambrosiozyma monospora]
MSAENIVDVPITDPEVSPFNITRGFTFWSIRPDPNVVGFPHFDSYPLPEYPLPWGNDFMRNTLFPFTLKWYVPVLYAAAYFIGSTLMNNYMLKKQTEKFKKLNPDAKEIPHWKKLPAVPTAFSKTKFFKFLVLMHNVGLCIFSVWTFTGMSRSIHVNANGRIADLIKIKSEGRTDLKPSGWDKLVCSICDTDDGMQMNHDGYKGLEFWAYWFYISKFYEVVDTMITLTKGRKSMFLQLYHHSGALLEFHLN